MRWFLFALLVACAGCEATFGSVENASTVHLERMHRGGYRIVRDDDDEAIGERDFARMYKARTGSPALDRTDHPHVRTTIIGLVAGSVSLGTAAILGARTLPGCEHCATDAIGPAALAGAGLVVIVATILHAAAGSPEEHDVPRDRAEALVDEYNRTYPPR